ncbi:MAG: DUF255 domain-containing protein [Bacteroidetes bacterium]|nr:MAG: DUF255 domain-containing protein [Bacteroidota bacterium]
MKKFAYTLTALFILVTTLFSSAQIYDPVDWKTSVEYRKDGKVDLCMVAVIEDHWHIYALELDEGGPIPTEFIIEESPKFTKIGSIKEPTPIEEFDPNFDMQVRYHGDGVKFVQTVEISEDVIIKGNVYFMVCNDEMCLPPEQVDFEFDVRKSKVTAAMPQVEDKATTEPENDNPVVDEVEESTDESGASDAEVTEESSPEAEAMAEVVAAPVKLEPSMSIWLIFVAGFGGGLLALFMPCIFPMIPLTVSFFTKQSKTKSEGIRKAIIYGISIIGIYVVLGMSITLIFGSDALNAMATNPYVNFAFFGLFVVFAISFFGAFEITLPSSWVNKAENASNRGGLIGVFFMAFTLALVSFSCTGPIIGTLLVDASSKGEFLGPVMGMFGFSLALALPFMLFAAFPGWMNSLPKSGGWLNTVKVTLGFLELAFAMKFFSTADLVLQLHWLERELFIAIWVGLSFVIALYLLGMFRMPHDSPVDRIGVSRMLIAVTFFIFGFYMLPGVWGAPVKLIAGFPPPQYYSESPGGAYTGGGVVTAKDADYDWGDHCPPGINCFNDYEEGLQYAKDKDLPIMFDFTGHGCVNCRKMEEQVWSDESVIERLNNKVVVISLYVDERKDLPESDVYVSDYSGKTVDQVGEKWSDFQASNFGSNSQPYYVIVNHTELTPLNGWAAFDPDIQKFNDWVDEGVRLYEAQK